MNDDERYTPLKKRQLCVGLFCMSVAGAIFIYERAYRSLLFHTLWHLMIYVGVWFLLTSLPQKMKKIIYSPIEQDPANPATYRYLIRYEEESYNHIFF